MMKAIGVIALAALTAEPSLTQKLRRPSSHKATKTKGTSPQKIKGPAAAAISAEMIQGKLNPAESKAGDTIVLRLKDDVKATGEKVLKKGTTITGTVRKVGHIDGKDEDSGEAKSFGEAKSLMEIEWSIPEGVGSSYQLLFAIESVKQGGPAYMASPGSGSGGGRSVTGRDGRTLDSAGRETGATMTKVASQSNPALLSMPSVVAADARTARSLETNFGLSGRQLFRTGHGQVVTPDGSKEALDFFSHMNNDTVVTSRSTYFEVSSGAQIQLLIGVKKN